MSKLNYHGSNTPNGTFQAFCWDYLHGVNYGQGRFRDLVLFAVVDKADKNKLRMDSNNQPMIAVVVCNCTKQKSAKAKINVLKRCLITKQHNISVIESYKSLPEMETFLFHKDFKGEPYSIKVENKSVNSKRVSNITHVWSYLADDYVDVRGVFDTQQASLDHFSST